MNGYMNYFQTTAALECLSGRVLAENRPVMILSSEMTRSGVYDDYVKSFKKLASAVRNEEGSIVPNTALTLSAFSTY